MLRGGGGPGWSRESALTLRLRHDGNAAWRGGRIPRGLGLRVLRREAWVYRRACGKPWKGFRKEWRLWRGRLDGAQTGARDTAQGAVVETGLRGCWTRQVPEPSSLQNQAPGSEGGLEGIPSGAHWLGERGFPPAMAGWAGVGVPQALAELPGLAHHWSLL